MPGSRYAADIAVSPGPSGRIWVAWADNIPRVRAVRTSVTGNGFGPVQTVGMPPGKSCTTSTSGECAITFPSSTKKGSLVAKATQNGYGAGSVRLKVT